MGSKKRTLASRDTGDSNEPPRKKKKTTSESTPVSEETAFPRGGKSALSSIEVKKIHEEVKQDLFSNPSKLLPKAKKTPKTTKKKNVKKNKSSKVTKLEDEDENDNSFEGIIRRLDRDAPSVAESISFNNLNEGTTLIGAIKEIRPLKLVITLPGSLNATVAITEISDELTERLSNNMSDSEDEEDSDDENEDIDLNTMFSVGQIVRCVVIKKNIVSKKNKSNTKDQSSVSKKKIEVSLKPSIINKNRLDNIKPEMNIYGSVSAEEDYGYIINFGDSTKSGFLKKSKDIKLQVGQPLELLVDSSYSKKKPTIPVTINGVNENISKGGELSLTSLCAGILAEVKIIDVVDTGLIVRLFEFFNATIPINQIDSLNRPLSKQYSKGDMIKARIILIDYENKVISMGLKQHIINWIPYEFPVSIGDSFDNAKVVHSINDLGLYLSIPKMNQLVFVHISSISDSRTPGKLNDAFPNGFETSCRITDFNYADGIVQASMKKSVMELEFLQHSDLNPGTAVRGTIIAIEDFGLLVRLSDKMTGLVPLVHLADVIIRKPAAKFKIDQKIKCRVLWVDSEEKKVTLTAKKTLLNSSLPLITSYDAKPGTISHGFIKSVKPNGVVVSFYNRVTAFAPLNEIIDDGSKPEDVFSNGQPIQCRVISSSLLERKMLVSFRVNEDKDAYESLELGSKQSGTILQIQPDFCIVQLESGIRARLRKFQFSDSPSLCDKWISECSINQKLNGLMVLCKPLHRPVELTKKYSICKSNEMNSLPSTIDELSTGDIVNGYVKRISSIGAHIGFMGDLIGFVPKSQIADQFVDNPSNFLVLGQSVRAYVIEIDQQRLILGLKQSLCATNGIQWIQQYFKEEKFLFRSLKRKNKKLKLSDISIGDFIKGTIKEKMNIGLLVEIDKYTSGIILNEHIGNFSKKQIGNIITVRVLDISQTTSQKRILDLSGKFSSKDKLNELDEHDKEYDATIELVKSHYLIVSVKQQIGFVPVLDYNSVIYAKPTQNYSIGDKLKVNLCPEPLDSLYDRKILFSLPIQASTSKIAATKEDILSLSDIQPGMLVKGKVSKVQLQTLKISVGHHVVGRVDVTEVLDEPSTKPPFSGYEEGDIVTAKVLKVTEIPSNRHLPISHQNPIARHRLDLTLKKSKLSLPPPEIGEPIATWKKAEDLLNQDILVVIIEIQQKTNSLGVQISPDVKGTIPSYFMPSKSKSYISSLSKHYSIGQTIKARVVHVDTKHKAINLSLQKNDPYKAFDKSGSIILGKIVKLVSGRGILVEIAPNRNGFVHITEISDTYQKKIVKSMKIGKYHKFYVLPSMESDKHVPLSLRQSKLSKDNTQEIDNPSFNSIDDLKENQIVSGYTVSGSKGKGITVALSRFVTAYVPHDEIADKVSDSIEVYFSTGRCVEGIIISIDKNADYPLTMSLKKSRVSGESNENENGLKLKDIEKGQKLKGHVKLVKDYGILIEIKNSAGLVGLCHKSEISDKKNTKWQEIFEKGDYVKVIVLNVDLEKNRLSLGMKPSYFNEDDLESDSENEDDNMIIDSEKLLDDDSDSEDNLMVMSSINQKDDIDMEDSSDDEDDDEDDDDEDNTKDSTSSLKGTSFKWNDFAVTPVNKTNNDDSEEEEESDDEEMEDESTSKKAKKLAKQNEEQRISMKESELLEGDKAPETIADYERLIVASPNDSYLWIKYMAFLLSMTEIEKARSVVERALKRINLREEEEKLNIWIAYINLEMIYGTNETLSKVIERALSYNDPKEVYLRLVDVYSNADKLEEAEDVYKTLTKKYKQSKGVWIKYLTFKMTNQETDEARKLFQRAINVLPRRKHIPLINKFAQLEYKLGDVERGRTMFEGIVSNYPKKIDIWSVYIDMEIKYPENIDTIRLIFERATNLKLSTKKMKFLFTKFLDFEKQYGDENTVQHVKDKVIQFLESESN